MIGNGTPESSFVTLGKTGLSVTGLGFGCYRVHDSVDDHYDALRMALERGCNLVDTSTNYGDGGSERLVGAVLHELGAVHEPEAVVVVSKVGYLQGRNLADALGRERRGAGYSDVVKYGDGCWHCIHPTFIEDQLTMSLDRLGQDSLDVYLLHNPEYFLTHLENVGDPRSLEERRDAFYQRIRDAFECMEALVAGGKLRCYGVSSNSFVASEMASNATSVARMLAIAEEVGGVDHHFCVVQLPMNVYESGAMLESNNAGKTALEVAHANNLAVLVNRPLNAIVDGQLIRLSDFTVSVPEQPVSRLAAAVRKLEQEFDEGLARVLGAQTDAPVSKETFRWADRSAQMLEKRIDVLQWDQYMQSVLNPSLNRVVQGIEQSVHGPLRAAWHLWLERYLDATSVLILGIRARCAKVSQRQSNRVTKRIADHVPDAFHGLPLSQQSLSVLRGCEGVSSVLVGMRSTDYVTDCMEVLRAPKQSVDKESVKRMAGALTE